MDFYILSPGPDSKVIFSRRNEHEGIFVFNTTKAGEYNFVFTNKTKKKTIDVTLALHTEPVNKNFD
jgi:hypothetical protein